MTLTGDYHTHTVYSHGKGLIEHNVLCAVRRNLAEVAISDHGFNHATFGVKRRKLPQMRAEVDKMRVKYPQVRAYLGVEANITNTRGGIDVREEDKQYLDIIVCGYHKLVLTSSLSAPLAYFLPNNLGLKGRREVARNTDAYVKALERNEIDILSHPGNFCKCDIREVARACKAYNTYFELNGKRILISDAELAAAAEEGCTFILSSDAHRPRAVGVVDSALAAAVRVGIPYSQIANIDKLPDFKRVRREEIE